MKISSRARPTVSPCAATAASNSRQNSLCLQTPTPPTSSLRLDPKGMLYAAGGSPAKVFRFDSNAKPSVVFDSTDLSAQAIAFDSKGTLYVGTSPDGKVYKVSATGEKSVFFDPKTKYIWDLAFGPDGTLYVASG